MTNAGQERVKDSRYNGLMPAASKAKRAAGQAREAAKGLNRVPTTRPLGARAAELADTLDAAATELAALVKAARKAESGKAIA